MNTIRSLFRLLSDLSGGRWGILVISMVLPVMIMMGYGFVLAIKYGHLLDLSITIAVSTLVITIPLYIKNRMRSRATPEQIEDAAVELKDDLVKASQDWSQSELVIWNQTKAYSRQRLQANVGWADLDEIGLDVLEFVANRFEKKALDFSIPEGLKLFEEISCRYKRVVQANIPGIEYLKISYIKAGYVAYEKYGELGLSIVKAALWANHAKNLYYNPLKVVSDLSKEQITSSMTRGVIEDIQKAAQEALLDEVAAVAIDLYSGRFSIEETDLQESSIAAEDQQRIAPELEPIRIMIVGQTGSGKSSIVNVLKDELVAEVDVLPSTESSTVYSALVDDIEVRIVDEQGLDGTDRAEKQMLKEMTHADLVLWVLKANQSARDLDKRLNDKFDAFYADPKNISRKKPTVISVVNQVDKLKPVSEWQPPYDLEQPKTAKAKIIRDALAYNQTLLHSDIALPLSVATDKVHFGVEQLKQALVDSITQANNVQRNRQRVEAVDRGVPFKKQLERAGNVGKKIAPAALKVTNPKLAEIVTKNDRKPPQ